MLQVHEVEILLSNLRSHLILIIPKYGGFKPPDKKKIKEIIFFVVQTKRNGLFVVQTKEMWN